MEVIKPPKRRKTGRKAKPKKAITPARPAPEPVGFRLALREEYRNVRTEGFRVQSLRSARTSSAD